jgi:putative acetyltransferase
MPDQVEHPHGMQRSLELVHVLRIGPVLVDVLCELLALIRVDGVPAACGGVKLDDGYGEVKRMYVEPDQRGKGVGRAVLARLEAAARQLGARRLVLETGSHSPDALALYRRAGFTHVDCWGEYATSPTSVCMEKRL